jgi:hypothetical protein
MMDAEDFLDSSAADEFLDGKRDMGELLDEIGEALAAMVKAMESGASDSAQTAKALDQMLTVLKARKPETSISAMVSAVKAIRSPDVNVTVSPTPVTVTPVVQILERVKPGAYEMTFTYDRHDRLETARLVPMASVPEPKKPAMMFGGDE